MSRAGVSFMEILIAMLVIAGLGVTIQGMMVSTVQGIGFDRATEAKRQLALDLLERFAHPHTDIEALFTPPGGTPRAMKETHTRELTLEECITLVAMPEKQAKVVTEILRANHFIGFTLAWTKGMEVGKGDADFALRSDLLWVFPRQTRNVRGALVSSFRVFAARGK